MAYQIDGYPLQAHVDHYEEQRKKFIENTPREKAKCLDPEFKYLPILGPNKEGEVWKGIPWSRYKEMVEKEKAA